MSHYDSIIIGAGHNGLVCAAYLAKSGQNVLVLEASDRLGGLAGTREFHPGFRAAAAHAVNHFSAKIARDLNLKSKGLQKPGETSPMIALAADGENVVLNGNSASGVSEADSKAYREYRASMQRYADALAPFWLKTMPRAARPGFSELLTLGQMGLKLRLMGREHLREFLRVASLPARDLADEFFEGELLKALVCWDALLGGRMAPRSPNSAILPLLYRMSGDQYASPANLVSTLGSAAESAGAEIRCNAAVERVHIGESGEGLTASGVELLDGEILRADRVISSADPQTTFLKLVGAQYLEIEFTNRIRRLRCEGYVAKLHLALDGMPEFNGLQSADGRLIIAPDMDAIEFAFDDAKYGSVSEHPVMEVSVPSLQDPSLAPDGRHVLSAHVMYVPHTLKGGWNEAARDEACTRAIGVLARYAPRISDQILHAEYLTPADLAAEYRVSGGHWHHTEFALDQALMMRPTYQAAQYHTPLQNLFLCGAGCHPAGDLTGAAGHNAAQAVLQS